MLAGRQHLLDLLEMQIVRRAEVDHVEIFHITERRQAGGDPRDLIGCRHSLRFGRIHIADRQQLIAIAQRLIRLDV